MRRLPTGEPMWDLEFDEKGKLWAPAVEDFLKEVVTEGIADLFMFSHGWDTSERSASQLYDAMFPMIRNAAGGAARLGTVGFVGIHWPTLRLRALPGPSTCGARSAGPGRRRRPGAPGSPAAVNGDLPWLGDQPQRGPFPLAQHPADRVDQLEAAAGGQLIQPGDQAMAGPGSVGRDHQELAPQRSAGHRRCPGR